jgi:hypothetical protein
MKTEKQKMIDELTALENCLRIIEKNVFVANKLAKNYKEKHGNCGNGTDLKIETILKNTTMGDVNYGSANVNASIYEMKKHETSYTKNDLKKVNALIKKAKSNGKWKKPGTVEAGNYANWKREQERIEKELK